MNASLAPPSLEALLRAHGISGPIYRLSRDDPAALQALKDVLLGSTMEQTV